MAFRKSTSIVAMIAATAITVIAIAYWGRDGAMVVAGFGTAGATVVLTWATTKLVAATKSMTPEPAVIPALSFYARNVFLELHNAGNGAAIDIDIIIEWKSGNGVELTKNRTPWRTAILPPGGRVRFNPPLFNGQDLQVESLTIIDRISVRGTMRNSRQKMIQFDRLIVDPAELYSYEVESKRQYPSNYEPAEIVADEMQKIRTLLAKWSEPDWSN